MSTLATVTSPCQLSTGAVRRKIDRIVEGPSMKRALLLFFLANLVTPAVGQNSGNFEDARVSFMASRIKREGSLTRCQGEVEMTTNSFVLRADEVEYRSDTGRAEARGNVRIQLLHVTPNPVPERTQQQLSVPRQ